jgi:Xaa-Pro aminopeptidase
MSINQQYRNERLGMVGKASGADAFLLTSPSTITWFSGYHYDFEIGPSPFQLIPAALLVIPEDATTMIIADNESFSCESMVVKKYASYTFEKPLDFTNNFLQKIFETIDENGLSDKIIGIEINSLPFVVADALASHFPKLKLVDVTAGILGLMAVKSPDEIEKIRQATALCDIGQTAVWKYAREGMSELELFNLVQKDIEALAGTRVPIMLDMVAGKRTAEGGGMPSNNIIRKNDLVLSDLTPCLNGYWGDTCNTIIVGIPTSKQLYHFTIINEALQSAIDLIKPGVKACEIDHFLRKKLEAAGQYGHHSGHGVGTYNHEEPRIVPYSDVLLEPNMVIALEPAIYTSDYGIRLEHLVLVTETGCEKISKFEHRFEQYRF